MAFIKEIQTPDNNKHQIKNTIIPVVGTQTVPSGETGIGQWTGNIDIPSLYDGLTIAYFLPCAGSGNATLNLTLSDGSTTGPIDCYYSSGRLTTHYSKGMNIIMTYWSAGSISIDGTPTDKDRWIAQGNYADGNNKVDQNNTTTSNWRHIMLGYASWTTAEPATTTVQQVAYKNNNIKISPAYGRLYMKGSSPQQYMVDTNFDLTASNNGVSAETWRALRFQDKNENMISGFISSVNTGNITTMMRTYNKNTGGTETYEKFLAVVTTKTGEGYLYTSNDMYFRLPSSQIDRDGTAPSSKITGTNQIRFVDKNTENIGKVSIAQDTNGNTELQLINYNENTSGTEVYNIIKLITAKDGTCSYYVSDGPAFRTAIGATDTKNTAGSTDTSSKIYLIGATEQSANPQTYSDNQVYVTNGSLYLTKTTDASGTANNKPALLIGDPVGAHLEFDDNEIMAKASGTTTGPLYINTDGGAVSVNGKLVTRWTSTPTAAQNEQITVIDGVNGQIKASGETIATLKNYVDTAIDNLPEPMVFKGTLGAEEDNPTITDLPTASGDNEGDTYKVITAGTYASIEAKVGDVFTSNGVEWILIPAGDDVEDTWRSIKVNGTEKLGTGISSGGIDFVNGTNTTVSFNASGNKISISSTDTNTTYSLSRNNKEIVLTGSDNTTSSVDAARATLLTNEDLNTVVLPGFYNAGGGNSCTNTPNPSSASGFGLIVLQTAAGAYYYQLFNYCGTTTTYRRIRNASTGNWSDWKEEKITDENVKQSINSEKKYYPLLFSSAESSNTTTDIINTTNRTNNTFIYPYSGWIYAGGGFCAGTSITATGGKRTYIGVNGIISNNYLANSSVTPYERNIIKAYPGKCPGNNGLLLSIDSGGLTIIGGGESAQNLASLIADDQTATNPARLDINNSQSASGKETTSFMGESEHLILSSDGNIYFATNCNTVGNRVAVCLDNNRIFYPMTNNTGKIGSSSYKWSECNVVSGNFTNINSVPIAWDNVINSISWSAGTLPSLTTKSTTIYPVTSATTTASKIVSKDTTIYPVKSTTTTATKVVTKSTTLYPVTSSTTTASKVVSKDSTIYPVTSSTTTASKVVGKDTTIYPVTSSTTTASKVVSKDTTIYPVKSTTTTATKVTTSSTTFDQITGVGTLPTLTVSGITLELNQGTLPTSSSVTINNVISNTDVTVPILSSSVTLKQISSISDVTVPILSSSVSIKQISSISDVTVPILSSSVTVKEISSISDVTVPILSSSVSITEVSSNSDVTVPILSGSVAIKQISSISDVTVPILSSSVAITEFSSWSAGTLPSLSWGSVSAVTGVST